MDTLPEIPSQRPSLTGKQATRGTPATRAMGCYEDSGLQVDLRESLASTSKQSTMRPLSPGGQRSPTPPNYLRPSTVSPRMQNTMRRVRELIFIDTAMGLGTLSQSMHALHIILTHSVYVFYSSGRRHCTLLLHSLYTQSSQSMESVRISRNELNHKEQLINTLRYMYVCWFLWQPNIWHS